MKRIHDRLPTTHRVPPTDEEMAAALPLVREQLRRDADMLDHIGHIAAEGGSLQVAFRDLAARVRSVADRTLSDLMDLPDYGDRQDLVALLAFGVTIDTGMQHASSTAQALIDTLNAGE